jgi:transposase
MKPYSDDLRSRVVAAMETGGSCRDVGALFGVAPSTAGNWHRQYRRTQSFAPLAIGGDRRSKLLAEADWIAGRLAEVPDLALTDVRRDLALRGTEVSYSGVWRMVHRLGLRFKKNDLCERAGPA